jgi:hypothetical protein
MVIIMIHTRILAVINLNRLVSLCSVISDYVGLKHDLPLSVTLYIY